MNARVRKIAGSPAVAFGKAMDMVRSTGELIANQKQLKKGREYWATLGPGLTTGASDDDPSGIATYSQAGAQYGFQLLWLAAFTFPLMAVLPEMGRRSGLVTGQGLAGNIRDRFPRWVLYSCTFLLVIANTLNIGADLGAMARATQLLAGDLNFYALLLGFALFSLSLQILTPYKRYAKYLKWLALVLLSYIFSALSITLDWKSILFHGFIPSFSLSRKQIFLICGILGTTISPYLFFWQTSQEIEEEVLKGKYTIESRRGATKNDIKRMRVDVWSGMFLSNIVMFFIIAACAATLYAHGVTNISTAEDAALALRPLAGNYTYLLFAVGIIGTGLLAIPVLAGAASYALSESLGWQSGLYYRLKEAKAFYVIIVSAMVIGFGFNFIGLDSIRALLYSAVVNGLVAPVILTIIVLVSSDKRIMGERANKPFTTFLGWATTLVMFLAGTATILSLFW